MLCFLVVMAKTHRVAMTRNAAAARNMWSCTKTPASLWHTTAITRPPVAAARICGKHIVQLNKPSTVPMRLLPSKALVTKVKGMASMAAQAKPMRMKGKKSR